MTTPETKWLQERASEIVQERDRLRSELDTLREQHSNVLRENECQRQKLSEAKAALENMDYDYGLSEAALEAANARNAALEPHGAVADLVSNLRGRIVELLARAERAEAECKAMREALEQIADPHHDIEFAPSARELRAIARAALNPSPAGREG